MDDAIIQDNAMMGTTKVLLTVLTMLRCCQGLVFILHLNVFLSLQKNAKSVFECTPFQIFTIKYIST